MLLAGHIASMGEMRNAYKILSLKGRDHSEDLGARCEDNIKMDVKEIR
jgi:hypothetical protein